MLESSIQLLTVQGSALFNVSKKGGVTVVSNQNNELISPIIVTGWRVYMDYKKLNKAIRYFTLR